MESKSPLPKKQKLTETSYNDIVTCIQKVVHLRKEVGTCIVTQTYSWDIELLKRQLQELDLKIKELETCTVPDMNPIFQGFRTLSKEYEETAQKLIEHISLLYILEKKNKCPIAKVIDEI